MSVDILCMQSSDQKMTYHPRRKKRFCLIKLIKASFSKKLVQASFIIYFWSFQTNNNICEKMFIQCRDSNPQPLERDSPSKTTGPGHPPKAPMFSFNLKHAKAVYTCVWPTRMKSESGTIVANVLRQKFSTK